ncbi:MAG TPA: glycine--tRNA ligase subunit beta [Gammaproteobacteria bacterium]|nr:glycine--tRNA ligase subunit beta [Gammaproteobacteria bacterium]
MSGVRDLLVEIGTEELPPRALRRLADSFADGVRAGLDDAGLTPARTRTFATPRRLAVLALGVPEAQPDRESTRRGPALSAAFDDDGNPTRAAQGFARSCGVDVEALERLETDKGTWLAHRVFERGRAAAELVPELVERALGRLPIPKRMRWGARSEEFVRPVHWVVLLFGDQALEATVLGVAAGRQTRGHRFHHPEPLYVAEPGGYAPLLETEGHVLADMDVRREAIRAQVAEAAQAVGGRAVIDEALLEEVTALVEWPVALHGSFDTRFLEVPAEALVSSMQDHQKYFPVVDEAGALQPYFVTVANIESRDPEQVRAGNERVIRPRLADAAFFWEQDRQTSLAARARRLATVVFQDRLGTLLDKQERVAELAATVAEALGGDAGLARRAAGLAKCDLLTHMVGEFPELQGIMGRYYATHDGEPAEVATALEEQYWPRFAGDALPRTPTGRALAIADRLDTLVGIFAIGQPPTGDKDPFALRRAALGVLRTLLEGPQELDLRELLHRAAGAFPAGLRAGDVVGEVFDFMMERLRGYYLEEGIPADVFEAVRSVGPTRPLDMERRLRACMAFRRLPEAESLAAANKRIRNILRKTDETIPPEVSAEALREPAEQALAGQLKALEARVAPLLEGGDYTGALRELASLRAPVDRFFDDVMVMAEEPALRRNRLALLRRLGDLFLQVADLSRLQG